MSDPNQRPVQAVLAQVAHDLGPIGKTEKNVQQGFSYRGIEQILSKAGPLMSAAGLVWLPEVVERHVETILVGKYEKPWRLVSLRVRYTIVGPMGDTLTTTTVGEGFDPGDKASNKAMTGAYKYALLQVLNIADGHEDSDRDPQADPTPRRAQHLAEDPKPVRRAQPESHVDDEPAAPAPKAPRRKPAADSQDSGAAPVVTLDDARRTQITALLDGIEDDDVRKSVKNAFMGKFGAGPAKLTDDVLDEALAFTQLTIAEPPF